MQNFFVQSFPVLGQNDPGLRFTAYFNLSMQ